MTIADNIVFRRNVAWQFVGSGSQMVLGLLVLAMLARGLGASGFGTFAVVTSLVLVANFFFEPRMEDVSAQQFWELHGGAEPGDWHHKTTIDFFLIEVLGKLAPAIGLIFVSPSLARFSHLPPDSEMLIIIATIGFYFSRLGYGLTVGLLRVVGRSDLLALSGTVENALRLAIVAMLYLTSKLTLTAAIVVPCLTGPFGMLLQWVCVSRVAIDMKAALIVWHPVGFLERTRASWRLLISNIGLSMTALMNKDFDIMITSSFLPAAEIGVYKVAKSLAQLVWKVLDPFSLSLVPEMSRLVSLGQLDRIKGLIGRSSAGLFALALILSIGIYGFCALFGNLAFSKAYSALPELLPYMLACVVFSAPLAWGHPLAVALNRADTSLVGTLIGSVAGIASLLYFAPLYGTVSVGIVWGVSLLVSCLYMGFVPLELLRRRARLASLRQ